MPSASIVLNACKDDGTSSGRSGRESSRRVFKALSQPAASPRASFVQPIFRSWRVGLDESCWVRRSILATSSVRDAAISVEIIDAGGTSVLCCSAISQIGDTTF